MEAAFMQAFRFSMLSGAILSILGIFISLSRGQKKT
jgi:hypothetical protein